MGYIQNKHNWIIILSFLNHQVKVALEKLAAQIQVIFI